MLYFSACHLYVSSSEIYRCRCNVLVILLMRPITRDLAQVFILNAYLKGQGQEGRGLWESGCTCGPQPLPQGALAPEAQGQRRRLASSSVIATLWLHIKDTFLSFVTVYISSGTIIPTLESHSFL